MRVKAHARTHAHTLDSLDHALLALRPSALPPVKTRRWTLPSLRAPSRKQALQLTSNLENEKLTSYRRGCNNGHTVLRFCPCRPILQTVIRPLAGGGNGGEPHFIRPGEITIWVATPSLLFTLPEARADKPQPRTSAHPAPAFCGPGSFSSLFPSTSA